MQIIVCDHANLDDPWFQEAVGENNWREGWSSSLTPGSSRHALSSGQARSRPI